MGKFLYDIFLVLYSLGIRVAANWNPKAKQWRSGRKQIILISGETPPQPNKSTIWMHCASLGEFEQGRPLLERIRNTFPAYRIVLSFFSPSGYESMKNYKGANHVTYLPMDSKENARKFIDDINPSLVLWIKYEFWYYYLSELKNRNIPVLLVSGIFRANQPFFKWYGGIWRKMLEFFTCFFVQYEGSSTLLRDLDIKQPIFINGDTRFDRVIAIAGDFEPVPYIESFCGSRQVIVAGSTWEEDETVLLHYIKMHPEIQFIIAPHEVDNDNITRLRKILPDTLTYSSLSENMPGTAVKKNLLIIDNIGMLSRLYRYATIAYIGGGFGKDGVHNVLEAAVYGKPVIFGPEYEKFAEAAGLAEAGGGISFELPLELESILTELLGNEQKLKGTGEASRHFVYSQKGSTDRIIAYIQEKRLLTS